MNKKSKFNRIIAIVSSSLLLLSATACGDSTSGDDGWSFDASITAEYKPEDTSIVLAENGKTDYVIVVPEETPYQVNQARTELQLFFQQSTGAALPVTTDSGITYDESKKYISLGHTTIYQGANMNLTVAEYEEDGFAIKRFGNTVVIAGAENNGTMYGIYDFLYYNLGVKMWANEEITVPKHERVTLKDFDYKSAPDIENRSLGIWYERYPEILEYRLKLNHNFGKNWIQWCHTSFELLPPATYQMEHPDWYFPNYSAEIAAGQKPKTPQQLCYTNTEMKAELINVLKAKVEASTAKYALLQIGQQDNSSFCTCDDCQAEVDKYGHSGLLMRFINEVADIMNPWVEQTYGGERTVKWIVFSYGPTVPTPTVKNADGSHTPIDNSVVAHKNVGVMIAPLGANWGYSLVDGVHNEDTKDSIEGWLAIKPEFYIYTYNVVFDCQMIFMDHWSYVKESYQIFDQIGANYIFDQSASHCALPFFELSNYVRSRLLWDLNVDVEAEIDGFMNAYYKTAAPKVKEYFDLVRTRYKLIEREATANGEEFWMASYIRYNDKLLSKEFWPKEWLLNGIKIYDEALALCEQIVDPEERQKASNRVKAERLSPIYLLMELYKTELSNADLRYYIETFREGCDVNAINYYTEHGKAQGTTVQKLLSDWSSQIT